MARRLTRYLRREVAPYSARYRDVLSRPDKGGPQGHDLLATVPLTTLSDVADPADLVLRPNWASLAESGDVGLAARLSWARLWGREEQANRRIIDGRYKPVHWVLSGGMPMGASSNDLLTLGDVGRRWLTLAGLGPDDVLVNLLPPGPNLAWWQVVVGARRAGISAIHLPPIPPAAQVAGFRPSVLAGRPFDLARLLEEAQAEACDLSDLDTLLVVGEPLEAGIRARLEALLRHDDGAVVSAWAPAGVRALWGECRYGRGLHTWPDTEVVEIVDPLSGAPAPFGTDGEVVWSALGWRGTVLLRLRTGVFAMPEDGVCNACGTAGRRLVVSASTPAFLGVLDEHAGVAGWQAELRHTGADEELVVFLSPTAGTRLGPLLAELDAELSALQYVVLDGPTLEARIAAKGDRRVVDTRV